MTRSDTEPVNQAMSYDVGVYEIHAHAEHCWIFAVRCNEAGVAVEGCIIKNAGNIPPIEYSWIGTSI